MECGGYDEKIVFQLKPINLDKKREQVLFSISQHKVETRDTQMLVWTSSIQFVRFMTSRWNLRSFAHFHIELFLRITFEGLLGNLISDH